MSELELDRCYTALCKALGDVGPQHSELLLAVAVLGLMARSEDAAAVERLIELARERCLVSGE